MVYDMRVPSDNMKLSLIELSKQTRAMQEAQYAEDKEHEIHEAAVDKREREQYATNMRDYAEAIITHGKNKAEFLQNVKESFLVECICKLYKKSAVAPMTKRDQMVSRNLVTRFVKENGVGDLLNTFSTRNTILSEFARITKKYYNQVLESLDLNEPVRDMSQAVDYNLDRTISDDFYDELERLDMDQAADLIRNRVASAMTDFIDSNADAKMEIQDLIQGAQKKISNAPTEEVAESLIIQTRNATNAIRNNRPKNVFNLMVEGLTRKALTDKGFKQKYVHEAKVDMESVVDDTALIYTMLEMINTTNMVNVDGEYINQYLKSIA